MSETWKDIPGYKGLFQVSTLGRVKKLAYISTDRLGNPLQKKEKVLKLTRHPKGYVKTRLFVNENNFKPWQVHRLVAFTFLGIPPTHLDQVNHINGIKDDNRLENLEWSNNSLNIKHAWANGLHNPDLPKGINSPHAVILLHTEYGYYCTIIEAAKELSVNRSKLSLMVSNKIPNNTKYIKA